VAGNAEAYKVYYDRYHSGVYASLKKYCGDDDALAQDLTQDVFKNCWDRRAGFKDEDHLANNLFYMARALFYQHVRNRMAEKTAEDLGQLLLSAGDEAAAVESRELTLARIENAIQKLPRQRKQVMELIHQGWSIRAVAKRMQLAEQTVRNHKNQALSFLRKELGVSYSFLFFLTLLMVLLSSH
jgi:RNA polymerase sigma factor (sigma-70 family)